MKKKNLKSLKLNKKSISNLTVTNEIKGGTATIYPFCFTTLSCVLICVTKICPKEIKKAD